MRLWKLFLHICAIVLPSAIMMATLLALWTMGVCDLETLAASTVTAIPALPYPAALFATIIGMPCMWVIMLQRSFFDEDATAGSELGIILHILYCVNGLALCLRFGLLACVPMFFLYWPLAALIRHALEPALAFFLREKEH